MDDCPETEQVCEGSDWREKADYGLRPQYPQAMGALSGGPCIAEIEKRNREARVQQAVYLLQQALSIRSDAALMAEVRAYIRRQRDEGAALLDDLG